MGGKKEILEKLMSIFKKTIPIQINELKISLNNKYLDQVMRKAHRIKSTSLNIRADALTNLALRIEKAARESNINEVMRLAKGLDKECHRIIEYIEEKIIFM